MVSDSHNFEQFENPGEDIVNLGEMVRYTTTFENFCHEISPTRPTFLVENDDITLDLKYKQGLESDQIYDLTVISSTLTRKIYESKEKRKRDKEYKGEGWEQFLKNRLSGLVVILYLTDESKARLLYSNLTDLGLTSIYLCDCKFGVPKFLEISDRTSLEKCLKEAYSKTHSASVGLQEFETLVSESVKIPPVSTGYKKLDELLDGGFYPGLYVIGAETSLGKSTFCLNLASNISERGRSVLYFSIEMSKFELTGRMLSRETYILSQAARERGHAQTSRTLMTGTKFERLSDTDKHLVTNAKTLFQAKARNLYLFENIGEMCFETVQRSVLDFIERTGTVQAPVVIIDYLQILRHKDKYIDSNDKLKTDKNLFLLKKLSNDYRLPIIAISSLNRDQTKKQNRLKMSAFKESGAIEYTADTLIGLQLEQTAFWGELSVSRTSEELQKDVRDIDLVILKNRNGKRDTHSHFKYHTWFNDFKEVPGFDIYPSKEDLITLTAKTKKKNVPDDDDVFEIEDDDDLFT